MKQSKLFPFWARIVILALFVSLLTPITARADMAPPQEPPGTNIVPGTIPTQVRMVAETVTLTVLAKPSADYLGQAATEAVFTMRNLGSVEEKMEARFPLTFWDVPDDGYGGRPEINDIRVTVDGNPVRTTRIIAPFSSGGIDLPWASFPVTFPPGKDVIVTARYTTNGDGYPGDPNFYLGYVLQTGAGWQGTIGSADIIVRLPYEANSKNVFLEYSKHADTLQFVGREVRWHFSDFEPSSYEDDISVSILKPAYWQKVLDYTDSVRKHPNDGEGWGQLGKAYKEIISPVKGPPFRNDPAAEEMYRLGAQAYGKAVALLPKDALWHYGFAGMLWKHYVSAPAFSRGVQDVSELVHAVNELHQSLMLDPNNQDAKDLANWISGSETWALSATDDGYDYLILTTTPTPVLRATEAPDLPTAAPLPELSSTPDAIALPTLTAVPATEAALPGPAKTPSPGLPVCGGTALLLPALAGVLWLFSKRR